MLQAFARSGAFPTLLCQPCTMTLWPGAIMRVVTDEESEVLPRGNPLAVPAQQVAPALTTRRAHAHTFLQGGWVLHLSLNWAAELDSPHLPLRVCFPANTGLQTSLVFKNSKQLLHIMKRGSIKQFDLIFPLNLMLMNLGSENLYLKKKNLIGFLTFKLAYSFFTTPRRKLTVKRTRYESVHFEEKQLHF